MSKQLFYIVPLIIMIVFGCRKKDYPDPVEANESFFYSKMLFNGEPVNVTSGKDGVYMYAAYSIDSSNVYNLTGEFKQAGCNNCPNSLKIQINDSRVSEPNSSIVIDSALQMKNYSFLAGLNDIGYSVDLAGFFNKSAASVLWDFGDGSSSTDLNPKHIFRSGTYKVTLTVNGTDLCQSVITNTLSLSSDEDLNAFINGSTTSNANSFTAHPSGGKAPYTYLWDFGDGAVGVNKVTNHSYALKGSYDVKLKVTDAEGKSIRCTYNAVAGGDVSACAANFSLLKISKINGRLGLSKISIKYTDTNGVTYTSDNAQQPVSSNLEILNVEEFVKNENNQPVKKLKLKFNCMLYNGVQSVSLQGNEVHVGVAYK